MTTIGSRGSILLLTLSIVTTLMVVAYAFVRVASLSHEANDNLNRNLLAREAAQIGLRHAVEQIVRDFTGGPLTRMDDSAHAAFVSHNHPYEKDYNSDLAAGGPNAINLDDIPAENALTSAGWHDFACGNWQWDGRGRFYEPEFYNLATAGFDPAAVVPTAAVKFGDNPWPAASPLPDRHSGIFYDSRMQRISTGNQRADRANARYRLRYALGAIDLDASLLITGDPAVDHRAITSADPTDGSLGAEVRRVVKAMHQLPAILYPLARYGSSTYDWNSGVSGKDIVQHIFIGRGAKSNFDIDPSTRAPVTFPLMYRSSSIQNFANLTGLYLTPASAAGGTAIPNDQTMTRGHLGPQFTFATYDESVAGTGVPNYDAKAFARGWATPFGRGLVAGAPGRWSGPVDTPWCVNAMTAPVAVLNGLLAGYMPPGAVCRYMQELAPGTPPPPPPPPVTVPPTPPTTPIGTVPITQWVGASYTATITGQRDLFVGKLSPAFAKYATPGRAVPAIIPDYHTPDTRPWHARYPGRLAYNGNPDNQPYRGVRRINDNLGVFVRSQVRSTAWTNIGGQVDWTGRPEVVRRLWRYKEGNIFPMHNQPPGRNWAQFWVRHGEMGTGSYGSGNQPDAPPAAWSSATTYVDKNRVSHGGMIYEATALAVPPNLNKQPNLEPTYWTNLGAYTWATTPPDVGRIGAHPDSIWDSVGSAMEAALSIARGMYLQYPNQTFSLPYAYFNASSWNSGTTYAPGERVASGAAWYRATSQPGNLNRNPATNPLYWTPDTALWNGPVPWAPIGQDTVPWDPAWGTIPRVLTVRDLDALFVTNLGSNWNVPRSPVPVTCWRALSSDSRKLESFIPTYNLASLVGATVTIEVARAASGMQIPGVPVDLQPDPMASPAIAPGTHGAWPQVELLDPPPSALEKADPVPPRPAVGSYTFPIMAWNHPDEPRFGCIAFKDGDGAINTYSATQRTAICELIINDMRLSLFGSSPGYVDDGRGPGNPGTFFRALDLNGDGMAHCSGFNSNGDATLMDLNLDRFTSSIDGNGVATVPLDTYFSNSGVLFAGKSRFWRIIVRGEVWDNVLNAVVNKAQLETVLVVDPANEAKEWVPGATPDPARGQYATHILHQKWRFDPYRAFQVRIEP